MNTPEPPVREACRGVTEQELRHEGHGIGKEDVPQVQGDPAQARRASDLLGPAPQAASGLRMESLGTLRK